MSLFQKVYLFRWRKTLNVFSERKKTCAEDYYERIPNSGELLDCKVNETELKADEDFIKGNKQNIIEELSKIGIITEIQSYFV